MHQHERRTCSRLCPGSEAFDATEGGSCAGNGAAAARPGGGGGCCGAAAGCDGGSGGFIAGSSCFNCLACGALST